MVAGSARREMPRPIESPGPAGFSRPTSFRLPQWGAFELSRGFLPRAAHHELAVELHDERDVHLLVAGVGVDLRLALGLVERPALARRLLTGVGELAHEGLERAQPLAVGDRAVARDHL